MSQASVGQDKVQVASVCPAFLKSNATSHIWSFSAIAELVDNAYDPDSRASRLSINYDGADCLQFMDNGQGMTKDKLSHMLSFGFSDKQDLVDHKAVGKYGNGFKSGSMRLGDDAIVFTNEGQNHTASIGLLSQTYNQGRDSVKVPIVSYRLDPTEQFWVRDQEEAEARDNLAAILQFSPFDSEEELIRVFRTEYQHGPKALETGTRIFIYNLTCLSQSEESELKQEDADIINKRTRPGEPEYRRSLRRYLSILYLDPKHPPFDIYLCGRRVKRRCFEKQLRRTELDTYTPRDGQPIRIKFGFTARPGEDDHGLMIYHRNRLIKGYVKVGCQMRALFGAGVGVVGVVNADHLTPVHNKQDFNLQDGAYSRLLLNVGKKLTEYYEEKQKQGGTYEENLNGETTWVECDACKKWRRLPPNHRALALDEEWFCRMNPIVQYNNCNAEEEPQYPQSRVSGGASYVKHERIEKRRQSGIKRRRSEALNELLQRRTFNYNSFAQKQSAKVRRISDAMAGIIQSQGTHGSFGDLKRLVQLCSRCQTPRLADGSRFNDGFEWHCSDGNFHCRGVEWVHCNNCGKRRYVVVRQAELPPDWDCSMAQHDDATARFGSCAVPEEQMGAADGSDNESEDEEDENDDHSTALFKKTGGQLSSIEKAMAALAGSGRSVLAERNCDAIVKYVHRPTPFTHHNHTGAMIWG